MRGSRQVGDLRTMRVSKKRIVTGDAPPRATMMDFISLKMTLLLFIVMMFVPNYSQLIIWKVAEHASVLQHWLS